MKWTPQNTTKSASRLSACDARKSERVASGVGPPHDVVALVVMAEDHEARPECLLGRTYPVGKLVGRRRPVALGERLLQTEHVDLTPFGERSDRGRRGQPGRPSAGLSASERYARRDTRPALSPILRREDRPGAPPATEGVAGAIFGALHRRQAAIRHSGAVINRPPASSIPDAPGSYQFMDAGGRVLYVGKAKSLRSRLSNYFADPATLPPRTAQMVAASDHVEWIQVSNDVEAVMLEYSLIKRHRPRFNIRLVDDKSYPWLADHPRR